MHQKMNPAMSAMWHCLKKIQIAIAFQEPFRLAPLVPSPRASPTVSTALGQGWQIVDGAVWAEGCAIAAMAPSIFVNVCEGLPLCSSTFYDIL